MISKAIALIMSVAGMILFLVGLFNGWHRHMIFGAVGVIGGLIIVRLATGKTKWHYDGATHRRFKYLRTTSECPFCKQCYEKKGADAIATINHLQSVIDNRNEIIEGFRKDIEKLEATIKKLEAL